MSYGNTIDRSPPDPMLEKTMNSRSPDIQEINEDIRQTHKIYHFQNCGTVCMSVDSFNARGVTMENCGNNIPQVAYQHPRIIGNENVMHSQSHAVFNAPTETAQSNVHVLRNALSPPQFPQPISPSKFSGDHTHHIKYLEQLLDASLATAAVIQFSGNTLADVLTPRAYDTFKALYALAALDEAASSMKPRGSEIPNHSAFPDHGIGNDCPYLSNHLSPFPNSSLALPRTGRVHMLTSIDYFMLFSWAGITTVFFLVLFFNLHRHCEGM